MATSNARVQQHGQQVGIAAVGEESHWNDNNKLPVLLVVVFYGEEVEEKEETRKKKKKN